MFDLKPKKHQEKKNLTVRLPMPVRRELDQIAKQEGWIISDMTKDALDHYIEEYKKRAKTKQQARFSFLP